MIVKWLNLDIFYKSISLSLIFTLFSLFISLIIFAITNDASWVFGALFSIGAIYFTYLLTWILIIVIPRKKNEISMAMSVLTWFIRVLTFGIIFSVSLFVIAPIANNTHVFDSRNIFHPLNSLWMLFVYLIPTYTYLSIPLVELIFKKIEKNRICQSRS